MTKLAPLSDKAKGLFASLGMTAQEAQQAILTKGKSQKEKSAAAKLLETTVLNASGTESAAGIIEHKAFDLSKYKPAAYVIFIRHNTCRNCKGKSEAHESATLFLLQVERKTPTTKLYTPVKFIEHAGLPRLRESIISTSPVCHLCFEGYKCQEIATSSPPQAKPKEPLSEQAASESPLSAVLGLLPSLPACVEQVLKSLEQPMPISVGTPSAPSASNGTRISGYLPRWKQDSKSLETAMAANTSASLSTSLLAPGSDSSAFEIADLGAPATLTDSPTDAADAASLSNEAYHG